VHGVEHLVEQNAFDGINRNVRVVVDLPEGVLFHEMLPKFLRR
jgi:hypothetical protein